VDDLHGTIVVEKIFHMAGAKTPQRQTIEALEKAIRESGREPMQRNTYYDRVVPGTHQVVKAAEAPELACA
jgi:aminodeoxyfutalosine synthase